MAEEYPFIREPYLTWYAVQIYKVAKNHLYESEPEVNTVSVKNSHTTIAVPDAPDIPGLVFRHFRGEQDYPVILQVIEGSKKEDQMEITSSVEEIANAYRHLVNCDPYQDMLFVEVHGSVVGYSRVWWHRESEGALIYSHVASLVSEWRNKGIRRAMLRYNERRLRKIAATSQEDLPRFLEARSEDTETHWKSLLKSEGYIPARYFFKMVRSLQEDIPNLPLPSGLEIRSAQPHQYESIWKAAIDAYQDAWESSQLDYELLKRWTEDPSCDPQLWQVAWDNTQVAGMALNFIDEKQNEEYQRKWGIMKLVAVCQSYRRKGLARALIARSFEVLKEHGMTDVALNVDAQDTEGALALYKKMGFNPVRQFVTYRKPMD